ncbi:DNA repair protein RecO [Chlamydiota bacterium]
MMSASTHQAEGIVLQTTPFKDYDRILTLFSPHGLLKFFVKISKRDYLHSAALTSPWTHIELHYTAGRKDLHRMTEGTILAQNLKLRDRFETLTAADTMVQALLRSQWQGKPAPKLYILFRLFLEHLPTCENPQAGATAFLIKILSHEGLLQLSSELSSPQPTSRYGGEQYPPSHAPPGSIPFSSAEEALLSQLALSRSLSHITALTLPADFQTKIATLFSQVFN